MGYKLTSGGACLGKPVLKRPKGLTIRENKKEYCTRNSRQFIKVLSGRQEPFIAAGCAYKRTVIDLSAVLQTVILGHAAFMLSEERQTHIPCASPHT